MRQLLTYMMTIVLLVATMEAATPASSESQPKIENMKATSIETGPTTPRLPYKPNLRPAKPYAIGKASWYGRQFHGRTTASGEPFDMFTLTAAHRTLPFGTRVRVTNLETGRSVVVRVNDRGPFAAARIIDVSYAAAKALGMVGAGVARVEMVVLGEGG